MVKCEACNGEGYINGCFCGGGCGDEGGMCVACNGEGEVCEVCAAGGDCGNCRTQDEE